MGSLKKRIILAGKGASGKDHLRSMLVSSGFSYCVSHTTRPPRYGEVHGKDYYFVSDDEAREMIGSGEFVEYTVFNGWIYGTSRNEFNSSDLFIMTPSGIKQLCEKDREESLVVLIDVPEEIRRERMSKRKDSDDVERRLEADRVDFENFINFDHIIDDPKFKEIPDFLKI
jgi:guanylate kinase